METLINILKVGAARASQLGRRQDCEQDGERISRALSRVGEFARTAWLAARAAEHLASQSRYSVPPSMVWLHGIARR